MNKRTLFLVLLAFFALEVVYGQGCSQCKLVAEQGAEASEDSFGSSINTGILYLMAVPYAILMFLFRKQIKRAAQTLLKRKPASN